MDSRDYYLDMLKSPWTADMGIPSFAEYPLYLGIALVLKTLFLWLLLRKEFPAHKIVFAAVVINLISHPMSYFGSVMLSMNFHIPWGVTSILALGWTVILETALLTVFLKRLAWSSALLYTLGAQAMTLVIGIMLGRTGI